MNMNLGINIYHDKDDKNCEICNTKATRYFTHIKTKKHIYNREQIVNKILIKELAEINIELELLKKQKNSIIKMYHTNEQCPICLEDNNICFNGMFKCDHSCCEPCFSKINNCPLCRAEIKSI